MTYANITAGKNYVYAFILCSDETWSIKYLGYYPDHFQVFLTDQVRSGRINIKGSVAVFAEFRSTTLTFHVDDQVVTTLAASGLMPSILLTNDQGSVLYSNFSYVPRT